MLTNLIFFAVSIVTAYLAICLSGGQPQPSRIRVRPGRPDGRDRE